MNRALLLIGAAVFSVVNIQAQDIQPNRIGSDSLFWVVETNIYDRSFTLVKIYDQQNTKVYEVRLLGEYLDIRNPKHRKKLDLILKQVGERASAQPQKKHSKKSL